MTAPWLSDCCASPVVAAGGPTTWHHQCTSCDQPCDAVRAGMTEREFWDGGAAEAGARAAQESPQPRRWIIDLPAGEPILTANHRLHKYKANARTQDLVSLMIDLCRKVHKLPRLEAVRVDLEYQNPPFLKAKRHPRASDRVEDHENLAPTRKALVDGIVRAGVLASDARKRVVGGECQILPGTHWMGQARVVITEVAGGER